MIIHIEQLTTKENGQLIGGFSSALECTSGLTDNNLMSNNCNSGNCKVNCYNKKTTKPATGTNTNCKGNCVKGCGKRH
ncbi:hypothetical protein [Hydrotalea sp.]|uniref:hypothetical protein n=1 Tax=Hydrotalea sp. TaxID=2881279 RepID=UPI003D0E28CF